MPKTFFLILVGVLFIPLALQIGCASSQSNVFGVVSSSDIKSSKLIVRREVVMKDIRVRLLGVPVDDKMGYLSASGISGYAFNETGRQLRSVILQFGIYDPAGTKVADALASTMNINVGGSWRFQAFVVSSAEPWAVDHDVRLDNVNGIYGN